MEKRFVARAPARSVVVALLAAAAGAQSSVFTAYSTSADFELGTLLNLHHEALADGALRLDTVTAPFDFLNVTTTNGDGPREGTVVRIDTETGEVLGEYRTSPNGRPSNPSRTTVDLFGNVWVGNRDVLGLETGGTVVKIGVVVGGTRCDADGTPNPQGQYLRPPFDYSTAVDRDGDGLIRTSRGLGDVLAWPDVTDGEGGSAGGPAPVEDALDELILVYQRTPSEGVHHVSVDPNNQVWVGGYTVSPRGFERLDADSGAILESLPSLPCGGYGGLVDAQGVVWSVSSNENAVMRYDPAAPASLACVPVANPYGAAMDSLGRLWISQRDHATVTLVGNDGTVLLANKSVPGAAFLRGIAVTPADDHVWVTDPVQDVVFRLDPAGDRVGPPIPVGEKPSGISVDSGGRVWVTCRVSSDAWRIDPSTGAVDLVVQLPPASTPYDYSDMAGTVSYTTTLEVGSWEVVQDGGAAGAEWGRLRWTVESPAGARVRVLGRASDNPAALTSQPWKPLSHNVRSNLTGRFLQVRASFERSPLTGESPTLHDLSVEQLLQGVEPPPCATPNRRTPGSLLLFPEFDSREGVVTLLTVTNVLQQDVKVEYVYIDGHDCQEFNRTELLTGNDTLTVIAAYHDPNDEYGYVYAFAKHAVSNAPIRHDGLIGQVMSMDGLEAFEYAVDAVSFAGVAAGATTDVDGDGVRDLDGVEYGMAPDQILIPRFLGQTTPGLPNGTGGLGVFRSELVLIALSGGPAFTTTVDFLVYNDNEEVFSLEHSFACWQRIPLLAISGVFAQTFLKNATNHAPDEVVGAPGNETGWMRLDGDVATSSAATIYDPAIYAVLIERVAAFGVADLPFELCTQPNGDLLASGLYGDE